MSKYLIILVVILIIFIIIGIALYYNMSNGKCPDEVKNEIDKQEAEIECIPKNEHQDIVNALKTKLNDQKQIVIELDECKDFVNVKRETIDELKAEITEQRNIINKLKVPNTSFEFQLFYNGDGIKKMVGDIPYLYVAPDDNANTFEYRNGKIMSNSQKLIIVVRAENDAYVEFADSGGDSDIWTINDGKIYNPVAGRYLVNEMGTIVPLKKEATKFKIVKK